MTNDNYSHARRDELARDHVTFFLLILRAVVASSSIFCLLSRRLGNAPYLLNAKLCAIYRFLILFMSWFRKENIIFYMSLLTTSKLEKAHLRI